MEVFRKAKVYVQDIYAGVLQEDEEGYLFSYDTEYLLNPNAKPVSITLPLQNEGYRSNVLHPFFDGLIPEGWLLNLVVRNWKVNVSDRFGLLLLTCKDSIGDVYLEEE